MNPRLTIVINKFGPIENQTVEFAPFMLFTGNSNLGKSYVNYLFYYVMHCFTSSKLSELIEKKIKVKKVQGDLSFKISANDFNKFLTENVQPFMQNFLGNEDLECDVTFMIPALLEENEGVMSLNFHVEDVNMVKIDGFDNVLSYKLTINDVSYSSITFSTEKDNLVHLINTHLDSFLQNLIFGKRIGRSVILPPARGSFVGESFSVKSRIAAQAGMYSRFLNDYDLSLKPRMDARMNPDANSQFFKSRVKELVKGDLISEEGKEKLVLKNGYKLPLSAAASSIKELSPLLFFLKNWSLYNLSFCLEEPEAHLHPSMQCDVADLLAACLNKGMYFQMTTHSDYFIQRINQLIRLGDFRKKDSERFEVWRKDHNLNQRFYLDRENVACYYFSEDENGMANIEPVEISDEGLQLESFYNIVRKLADFDDELEIALNTVYHGNIED